MAPSKAHAVQTSARASMPVEPDMFVDSEPQAVAGLWFQGCLVKDAVLAQRGTAEGPAPVVIFDMLARVGSITFPVHVEQQFTPATRAAAAAKAAHCRKGTFVEVHTPHAAISLVLAHCSDVQVLEGQPQ